MWEAVDLLYCAAVIGVSESWVETEQLFIPVWVVGNLQCVWNYATRRAIRGRGSGGLVLLIKKEFELMILDIK